MDEEQLLKRFQDFCRKIGGKVSFESAMGLKTIVCSLGGKPVKAFFSHELGRAGAKYFELEVGGRRLTMNVAELPSAPHIEVENAGRVVTLMSRSGYVVDYVVEKDGAGEITVTPTRYATLINIS